MDNILVIIDGILAKYFLERLCLQKALTSFLHIVYYNDESISMNVQNENTKFYKFDPTSSSKMQNLLIQDFTQIFIYMKDEFDAKNTYENLRSLNKEVDIVLMDFWGLSINDKHCDLIDARGILSNRFLNFLPNIAHTAQFVGLGIGEIMEVKIPANSAFAYRYVGSIEQKKWRIALIYRNAKMIFANPSLILLPNDSMLIVGEPSVLQGIFHKTTQSRGQFPSPFGSNILAILDMKNMSLEELENAYESSLFLHSKINNKKLLFRVINPSLNPLYHKLKELNKNNISVHFEYDEHKLEKSVMGNDVGVLVLGTKYFETHKKELFKLKIPVLKLGLMPLKDIKEAIILSSDESEIEKQANVTIDLGKQLDMEVKLYHYDPNLDSKQILEHFSTLSKLYNKEIKIIDKKDKNPILEFSLRSDSLQFISFNQDLAGINFAQSLSMDLSRLYYKMNKNYQLFIPMG
ncbi:potassium transporter TrkA [Campylobacter sp. MIT 99-7217]|uniref:COG3400 family protein n=1 Tax=Campylobacter sp. MIT 99-7217 TaxID=535091 RepID=UPI0011584BDB|nr:TrkA C-terminal domain-containing protein [Campylobacter sp. MIT 99-7217]TQR34494.1 potassium transporter TrkA [Campylobacter sp. MIT 99-7217]